jgi:hypothetical protein
MAIFPGPPGCTTYQPYDGTFDKVVRAKSATWR